MPASNSASLTTTGSATLTKPYQDTLAIFELSGDYTTTTFVFEGSVDGTNFFPLAAVKMDTGVTVSGTISPSDASTRAWKLGVEGLGVVRARVTAIATNTATFAMFSAPFVGVMFPTINQTGQTVSGNTTFGAGMTLNGGTGTNTVTLTDNLASALNVVSTDAKEYLKVVTTDSSESLVAGQGLVVTKATGAGLGYATGAGGTVTQGTDRSTGVTLSKLTGAITTNTASLAAGAEAKFTVTNTTVAATDTVVVSLASGNSGVGTCLPWVSAVGSGSFDITITNTHASTAETGACVLNFAVIKAVAS